MHFISRSCRHVSTLLAVFVAANLLALASWPTAARAVQLKPGDIVITGQIGASGSNNWGLLQVDPTTGDRTVISDQTHGAGTALSAPESVTLAPDGTLLVADLTDGIIRVDPSTGNRAQVFNVPFSMRAEQVGNEIYYTTVGRISGIDATTHQKNFISASGIGSGPTFAIDIGFPAGFVIVGNAAYVASAQNSNSGSWTNGIVNVNLTTANRTLVSGNTTTPSIPPAGSGPAWNNPLDVALDAAGQLIVTSTDVAGVARIDPVTGARTIVSSNAVGTGPALIGGNFIPGDVYIGIAVEANGAILLSDTFAPTSAAVFRVDPVTGNRTILSDATHGNGPAFNSNYGIFVVPNNVPEPSTLVLAALGAGSLLVLRRRAARLSGAISA